MDDSDSDAPAVGRGATAACDDLSDDALVEVDLSGARFGKGLRARGSKRRRSLEENTVPEDVWKRFTPAAVDFTKCLGRMWSGGRGGQCKCLPSPGRALCAMHSKSTTHGLVTGAIPYGKLQEFLRAEESARKRVARGEGGTGGGKLKADRRKRHWYARYLLWAEAEKLDTEERRVECGPMEFIDDLGDEEFTECL